MNCSSRSTEALPSQHLKPDVSITALRKAIPSHCFESSYTISLIHLFRDVCFAILLTTLAYSYIPSIEQAWLQCVAWACYGFAQGLVFVGFWVLGHECSHSAFSPSDKLNNSVGFVLHSFLLTPYFAWRSTHRRHHIYANNLAKDQNYVPLKRDDYAAKLSVDVQRLEELTEDAPIVTFLRILLQQAIGWPWYLLTNITAAETSLVKPKSKLPLGNSHLMPFGSLFRVEEAHLVIISDIGLLATALILTTAAKHIGVGTVALLYLQPYIWVNHWLVAITYLHHTHPELPKFEDEAWTFLKGALATVDREFGWVGKHLFHSIIEFHVIHHLFPRIPFYHAEEATRAIIPLLGIEYHTDKQRAFLPGLWENFTRCQWVEPDDLDKPVEERTMWYKGGPSPAPQTHMGVS